MWRRWCRCWVLGWLRLLQGGASADRSVTRTSADGWKVTATKSGERVVRVHPLNNAPWTTKEAFLSLRGSGRVSGAGTSPVMAGSVSTGFQVGCGAHFDSLTAGISAGPTAQMSISYPPAVVIGGQVMGTVSANLRPGTIEVVDFGTKSFVNGAAGISLDGVSLRVTGCVGTVAVRSVKSRVVV